jgi:hypothetical protein
MPFLAWLLCTTARARTSPAGTSNNNWMQVPAGGGSTVRIYKPPNPRLTTPETFFTPAFCQANIVPFGEDSRAYWRASFIIAAETAEKDHTPFLLPIKDSFQTGVAGHSIIAYQIDQRGDSRCGRFAPIKAPESKSTGACSSCVREARLEVQFEGELQDSRIACRTDLVEVCIAQGKRRTADRVQVIEGIERFEAELSSEALREL